MSLFDALSAIVADLAADAAAENCPHTKKLNDDFEFEADVEQLCKENQINVGKIDAKLFPQVAKFRARLARDADTVSVEAGTVLNDKTVILFAYLDVRMDSPEEPMGKFDFLRAEEEYATALFKKAYAQLLRYQMCNTAFLANVKLLKLQMAHDIRFTFTAEMNDDPTLCVVRNALQDVVPALFAEIATNNASRAVILKRQTEAEEKWAKFVKEFHEKEKKKNSSKNSEKNSDTVTSKDKVNSANAQDAEEKQQNQKNQQNQQKQQAEAEECNDDERCANDDDDDEDDDTSESYEYETDDEEEEDETDALQSTAAIVNSSAAESC